MTRKHIANIISSIDERHVNAAAWYNPPGNSRTPERMIPMKNYYAKKPLIIAAIIALVSALGVTAYAAGWLSPIFHKMQNMFAVPMEERNALYAAAEQYMNDQQPEPETVTLPEFDNSSITLNERYYDGENLLLGINLDEVVPDMVIGYAPDGALKERINNVAFFYDVKGNDDLDYLLEQGLALDIYNEYLSGRTAYARTYDFRNISAIEFDWYLKRELTPEAYKEAWKLLRETGQLCVVSSSVYIGDHIVLDDGTDLGPHGQLNLDEDGSGVHSGDIFIEINDLPETARNQDDLRVNLKLKNTRAYYYMELGGPAYEYYEVAGESMVSFTVENSNK